MNKIVFLSHSCDDHLLTQGLASSLKSSGYKIFFDPFGFAERTCKKIEACIKSSTHFVQFYTENCVRSRWVEIESIFAKLCFEQNAISFVPIRVNKGPVWAPTSDLIYLTWNHCDSIDILLKSLSKVLNDNHPTNKLSIDHLVGERIKELGRRLERSSRRNKDKLCLHDAVEAYDLAIRMSFSNHHAWANQAWTLWKLNESARAWKLINTATLIAPDSKHVQDVLYRMKKGKKTIDDE